jgi:hypothetical protein
MQKVLDTFSILRSGDIVRYFSILSIVCLGYAFGRILMVPGPELSGSRPVQALLIAGTCLFAQYLLYLRKSCGGVNRGPGGCIRPALKELLLCGGLNGVMAVVAVAAFLAKPHLG